MKNIVTIGGGNGHSHLLGALKNSSYFDELEIHALVSMSDDGRTTGKLMKEFELTFGRHLPPPGDLRRCIYALSGSEYASVFQNILESTLDFSGNISDYSLRDICVSLKVEKNFMKYLESKNTYFLDFSLSIKSPIAGHKFGNILMACLYQNFLYDYNYMLRFMHDLLDVKAHAIAITTDKAYIEAELENGEVIEKQDNISNDVQYSAPIKSLRLMKDSQGAKHNFKIDTAILGAEYIIISAGDLFTSTISNLIIGGINSLLRHTNAKIICIGNTTNKGGETSNYSVLDFMLTLEKNLGKQIDVMLLNNKKVELSTETEQAFKENISVKGGDYIYLTFDEKQYLQSRSTRIVEADLLDEKSLYKHDAVKLASELEKIIF